MANVKTIQFQYILVTNSQVNKFFNDFTFKHRLFFIKTSILSYTLSSSRFVEIATTCITYFLSYIFFVAIRRDDTYASISSFFLFPIRPGAMERAKRLRINEMARERYKQNKQNKQIEAMSWARRDEAKMKEKFDFNPPLMDQTNTAVTAVPVPKELISFTNYIDELKRDVWKVKREKANAKTEFEKKREDYAKLLRAKDVKISHLKRVNQLWQRVSQIWQKKLNGQRRRSRKLASMLRKERTLNRKAAAVSVPTVSPVPISPPTDVFAPMDASISTSPVPFVQSTAKQRKNMALPEGLSEEVKYFLTSTGQSIVRTCIICNKYTSSELAKMREHVLGSHFDNLLPKLKCEVCGKLFGYRDLLKHNQQYIDKQRKTKNGHEKFDQNYHSDLQQKYKDMYGK